MPGALLIALKPFTSQPCEGHIVIPILQSGD